MTDLLRQIDSPLVAGAFVAAFAALGLAVLGLLTAISSAITRYPDLVRRYHADLDENGRILNAWRFAKEATTRRLQESSRFEGIREALRPNLVKAGYATEVTAEVFLGGAIVEGIAVTFGIIAVSLVLLGSTMLIPALGLGALHALWIRPYLLQSAAETRVRQISRRLPSVVDLCVLILEAGGTLGEGLKLAAEGREDDPLAQEIRTALEGVKAGQPLQKALQEMADRIELEDMSTLVLAIVRGEEMGAPMKQTLRTQSDVMRFRRYQRAEKLISEAPVKMMVPNMLIMLATLLVVLGPVLIKLMTDGAF